MVLTLHGKIPKANTINDRKMRSFLRQRDHTNI